MRIKIHALLCFALIISFPLIPSFIEKSKAVERHRERRKHPPMEKFQRKMMMDFLRLHHPDVLGAVKNIRAMESEAHNLAREFKHSTSEDEKRRTANRIRRLLEEAARQKFELTEMTLEGVQQKLDELRSRHDRNKLRFDELIEYRLERLLH